MKYHQEGDEFRVSLQELCVDVINKKKGQTDRLLTSKTLFILSVHNERRRTPNTVTALLPSEKKQKVHSETVTDIPAEGDTSMFHIANALSNPDLFLERVTDKYNHKRGGLITC